ncbi:MAG: ABC transporter substrate-binding protein [Bernardetiaceae bacterium]|nr:ABC transporter substrate-binding protein [Bernardetiaceae bacterium]
MKYTSVIFIFNALMALFLLSAVVSCQISDSQKDESLQEIEGGRFAGGVFNVNETEYIRTLFPHNIVDIISHRVASQIYEGLFEFNPKTLKVQPALAASYQISEDLMTYTINIKKGVKFHDSPVFEGGVGRELTAKDVAYCFTLLCTRNKDNQGFHIFDGVVKGARTYYDNSKDGLKNPEYVEGIEILDSHTIKIQLLRPNAMFLNYLARPEGFIFPRELYEKSRDNLGEQAVGTGAFKLGNIDDNRTIILNRNPKYHRKDEFGNQLPYLDAVKVSFIKDKQTELLEFKSGKLDLLYRLPTDHIIQILDEYKTDDDKSPFVLDREPEMQTQMLVMMNKDNAFQDVNVRKAISFAINRQDIVDYVLGGEAFGAGHNGITPPAFSQRAYNTDKIPGYEYNPDSARYYLAKAGYPNGKGFPALNLEFHAEGDRNTSIVVEIKKNLKNVLNIDVNLATLSLAQVTDKSYEGNYTMLRLAWIADFPSPEPFLRMFYGKNLPERIGESSYPNLTRYSNPAFDALYEKAMDARTEEESFKYFMEAEILAMQDAPVVVLWYDEAYRILQNKVKNLPNNSMQYRDYSQVYFVPQKEQKNESTIESNPN